MILKLSREVKEEAMIASYIVESVEKMRFGYNLHNVVDHDVIQ
jgi:hypothetical protein